MWQSFLRGYLNRLYESKAALGEFKALEFDRQRVLFCAEKVPFDADFRELCAAYRVGEKRKGDARASDEYRQFGNEFYKKRDFQGSFYNYSLAIKHAACGSEQLLLAYSNRSAVFFELKMFNECLTDLNQVKALNGNEYPKHLESRLSKREESCCLNLPQPVVGAIEAKQVILGADKYVHMSSMLDVKYSRESGRYCVVNTAELAKEDKNVIQTGEVLFHEKPYCSILLPQYQESYCENCYKQLTRVDVASCYKYLNIEYCDKCLNVVYCSSKCKQEAARYHVYECCLLDLLYDLGIAHLAYRIIAKTSFKELLESYSDRIQTEPDLEQYFKSDMIYSSSDYEPVFNLVTNSSSTHVDDLFQYTLTAILLSKLYFAQDPANDSKENMYLVATLISRHIQQTICNAHAITKLADCNDNGSATYSVEQIRYATALYPTVSLMNHSCDPNVICSFRTDSNEIIIKAAKDIPVDGDAHIWNCYGPHYLKMEYPERKQVLSEQYHFKCECKYCQSEAENFELTEQNVYTYGFKCLSCGQLMTKLKCSEKCNLCKNLSEYKAKLRRIKCLLRKTDSKSLLECIGLHETIFLDTEKYTAGHETVQNATYMISYCKLLDKIARQCCEAGSFEAGAEHLQKSIRLLKFIYNGADNVEIALELFKLSEIQCNCMRYAKALGTINEAIEISSKISNTSSQLSLQLEELKKNIESCL